MTTEEKVSACVAYAHAVICDSVEMAEEVKYVAYLNFLEFCHEQDVRDWVSAHKSPEERAMFQ